MGIRETLNQHTGTTLGLTGAAVVVALLMTIMQLRGGSSELAEGVPSGKFFYTTDDGKTWFIDDSTKFPPFMKDGKEAVRAYVYRTKDGKEFVGLLERYTLAAKKSLEAAAARPPDPLGMEDASMAAADAVLWKKPGQTAWVSVNDPRAAGVQTVVSPNGAGDTVQLVTPGQ
jgi:hypothetical protein